MIPIRQIKETCLYVKDLDRSKAFYHEKLGLPLISHTPGRHIFFRAGTSVLLCFLSDATKNETRLPPHHGDGNLHFAFEVDPKDYQGAKAFVESNNITIEQEVDWGGLMSFYFRDPDNHLVEIVMHDIWT